MILQKGKRENEWERKTKQIVLLHQPFATIAEQVQITTEASEGTIRCSTRVINERVHPLHLYASACTSCCLNSNLILCHINIYSITTMANKRRRRITCFLFLSSMSSLLPFSFCIFILDDASIVWTTSTFFCRSFCLLIFVT